MNGEVVSLDKRREEAKHKRREEKVAALQKRFEKALPTDSRNAQKSLLKRLGKKPKR